MQSKCSECGIKKSRFAKEQEPKGLLSNLGIKTMPLLNVLFYVKMNEIVNKILLVGDKFMPEMHLKQHGFTYSACGPFTKNKERIDVAYGKSKDLVKRTQSNKVSRDKEFKIVSDPKYDGYQVF